MDARPFLATSYEGKTQRLYNKSASPCKSSPAQYSCSYAGVNDSATFFNSLSGHVDAGPPSKTIRPSARSKNKDLDSSSFQLTSVEPSARTTCFQPPRTMCALLPDCVRVASRLQGRTTILPSLDGYPVWTEACSLELTEVFHPLEIPQIEY